MSRLILACIGVLFVLVGLTWASAGHDLLFTRFFEPKREAVRRETFEQSKAYIDGMVKELQAMQFEYVKADKAHKAALGSIILNRVAGFDENHLPADLYVFIKGLRSERAQ